MGKKKRKHEHHEHDHGCVPCKLQSVLARYDMLVDAFKDLQPHVQHYAGLEAWIRLNESKMWFDILGGDAHEQNIRHTCQDAHPHPDGPGKAVA